MMRKAQDNTSATPSPAQSGRLSAIIALSLTTLLVIGIVKSTGNFEFAANERRIAPEYEIESVGQPDTFAYKVYFIRRDPDRRISPWHDIPLKPRARLTSASTSNHPNRVPKDEFLFVLEIPKGTKAKLEINKEHVYNPIIQDIKKEKLRYYPDPSVVHYGAFPQTWEDPSKKDHVTGNDGDNDPLDVLDISDFNVRSGDVYTVKVLGALGMVDGGEMDWKILTAAVGSSVVNDGEDVHTLLKIPFYREKFENIRVWFRDYKIPDGKPPNEFAWADEKNQDYWFSKETALKIIKEQHGFWKELIQSERQPDDELWWEQKASVR